MSENKKYELKIGNVTLPNPTILAPMEAVNCEAFLQTCSDYSCGLVNTQAIEDVEDNFYNMEVLKKINAPVSFQIMTNKAEIALELAKQVEPFVDIIDFNFGCPLKKTLGEKKGGYLLQFPHLIRRIVEPVIKAIHIPVTIKIRLGFDATRETFLEIGKVAEEIGVSAITLHARYVKDGYKGKANWEKIKELKESVSIPVIANGDIFKAGQAKMLLDQKYCDGVMLGRSVKNNPAFFLEIKNILEEKNESKDEIKDKPKNKTKNESKDKRNNIRNEKKEKLKKDQKRTSTSNPKKTLKNNPKEIFEIFYEHYMKQKKKSLGQLQDHACWIVSGEENASWFKAKIRECETFEKIAEFISKNIH